MPHLTGRGHTKAEIESILVRYAESGVDNILALRGDPPKAGDAGPVIFPMPSIWFASFNHSTSLGATPTGALPLALLDTPKGTTKPPTC